MPQRSLDIYNLKTGTVARSMQLQETLVDFKFLGAQGQYVLFCRFAVLYLAGYFRATKFYSCNSIALPHPGN